jgi:hypothetical protein
MSKVLGKTELLTKIGHNKKRKNKYKFTSTTCIETTKSSFANLPNLWVLYDYYYIFIIS